jgi:uncharacterized membrane-anchored protein YjiN (DUF445 family)
VDQVMSQVMDQVVSQVMDQVVSQVVDQVVSQRMDQVVSQVMDQVVSQVMDQVVSQVMDQVVSQVMDQVVSQAMHCQWLLTAPMMKENLNANEGNYQKLTESSPAQSVIESMGAVLHCTPTERRNTVHKDDKDWSSTQYSLLPSLF